MANPTGRKPSSDLLTWRQIKPWQQDNEHILTGYRPVSRSYKSCFQSCCQMHNETVNIWTHLLPCILFSYQLYEDLATTNVSEGSMALAIFYCSVAVCFLLSTLFHALGSHSESIHEIGHGLDHFGIVLVFLGTGVSTTHLAFLCDTTLRWTYILLLCGAACLTGVVTTRPAFRQAAARPLRMLVYALLGLSLFLPSIHAVASMGWTEANAKAGLDSFAALAVVNFSGAAIYAVRVPERWTHGRTDFAGQSHNIMHILVVVGAVIREQGLRQAIGMWNSLGLEQACR